MKFRAATQLISFIMFIIHIGKRIAVYFITDHWVYSVFSGRCRSQSAFHFIFFNAVRQRTDSCRGVPVRLAPTGVPLNRTGHVTEEKWGKTAPCFSNEPVLLPGTFNRKPIAAIGHVCIYHVHFKMLISARKGFLWFWCILWFFFFSTSYGFTTVSNFPFLASVLILPSVKKNKQKKKQSIFTRCSFLTKLLFI